MSKIGGRSKTSSGPRRITRKHTGERGWYAFRRSGHWGRRLSLSAGSARLTHLPGRSAFCEERRMIERLLSIVVALFPISEVALAIMKRSLGRGQHGEDRGSMRLLWLSIAIGLGLAIAAQSISWARLPGPAYLVQFMALILMLAGLAVRWLAILTLGRFFTVDVGIHPDHVVVQSGIYGFVRHPSYTGLLVAFLGLGVFFANWLSIVGLLIPIVIEVVYRVAMEERALFASLGPEYVSYCDRTERFIPGLWSVLIVLVLMGTPSIAARAPELIFGTELPPLEGTTLNGESAALPRDAEGH